ncbi:hypothetical protein MAR_033497 [Mya arenaria]|uniref:Uncharacterized protein n=1 Tax=Mya arenaria TaxID=6604 RepID=A0ABY7G972_MYAAR|nr:hypothetical protein MAR_033497 [Mya arenaria]
MKGKSQVSSEAVFQLLGIMCCNYRDFLSGTRCTRSIDSIKTYVESLMSMSQGIENINTCV